jgi:C_GCAxxG_C_C family probable redox protein
MIKPLNIKQIEEKALSLFNSDYNCSQSVLSAYSDYLDLDNEFALSVSCGFGSGMGRLQGTCGAVTGAYMVFSVYCSNKFSNNSDRKSNSYLMIQEFNNKFIQKHNTTDCKSLLNCDLRTEEGQQQFYADNLIESVCVNCIKDSVKMIKDQIEK